MIFPYMFENISHKKSMSITLSSLFYLMSMATLKILLGSN